MEQNNELFSFDLQFADNTVTCEVIMKATSYDVLFNGKWVASVEQTEEETWRQLSGEVLSQETIDTIGFRIEGQYM